LANVLVLVNASINLPQWKASPPHAVKKITAKIVALKFVQMMLGKLWWLSSL